VVPPRGRLTAADISDIQFAVVPRGYSMEQVDALLHRLADQLDHEEAHGNVVANPGPRDLE